ncbi:unnamed protein product [Clonostachys chloroleuca]|uniref:Uncharacterized protein n=1 Tax=Clonostachys chloroleuca TaxID=1926264 RepID=A0AA35QD95_9HYPO|nr:unnamed protein product [Clonostachys chloroleuca]
MSFSGSVSTAPLPTPPNVNEKLQMREETIKRVRFSLKSAAQGTTSPQSDSATISHLIGHVSPQLVENDELQIYFLPPISRKNEGQGQALLDDPVLCRELTDKLHLEPFFLTTSAWDSNGFFSSRQLVRSETQEGYSYGSRFLIKFLAENYGEGATNFSWSFVSFSVLWSKNRFTNKVSCVLVCYDDAADIKTEIVEGLRNYTLGNIRESPYAVFDAMLGVIVWQFDKALWKFRTPIRTIEKTRRRVVKRRMELDPTHEDGGISDDHPEELAELSRHTLHMTETISVAMKTASMALLRADTQSRSVDCLTNGAMRLENVVAGIQFSSSFLGSLKERANAFAERVRNEIQTANNLVNILQLKLNEDLLEEARDESKDLTRFVTNLTLFFLPVTFVSGFWGMNLVELDENKLVTFSPHIWMFVVSAVGAVAVSYSTWYLLFRKTKDKGIK